MNITDLTTVVPSPRQLAWQQTQYYGFIHFGINTMTDREWGFGNEPTTLFDPQKLDAVVHLAAHAKVHELVVNPARALENITMTFNVLEFCRHHNLPIIFSSSREVYGDIHRYITEESHADFAFTESPYSASKISGEALVYS